MTDVLRLLETDGTLTVGQIAAMLDRTPESVSEDIARARAAGVLLGVRAVVDWAKTGADTVTAMIEVHTTPQRGEGFDRVAERIYQFDEVQSLYLMSGGFDLQVIVTGRSLSEIARFVSEKLSALDAVTGTATHFLLKKYKESGVVYKSRTDVQERVEFI